MKAYVEWADPLCESCNKMLSGMLNITRNLPRKNPRNIMSINRCFHQTVMVFALYQDNRFAAGDEYGALINRRQLSERSSLSISEQRKSFAARGIDFCCGGNMPLATVCAQKGIDPRKLSGNLKLFKGAQNKASILRHGHSHFLADYIVNTHHTYLKENDDQIAAYARKIAAVHGANHPEVINSAL